MRKTLIKLTTGLMALAVTGVVCVSAVENKIVSTNTEKNNAIVVEYKAQKPSPLTNTYVGDGNFDSNIQNIEMQVDKDFKIICFTDTHINGEESLKVFLDNAEALIMRHKPDLVILNGDNIDNWNDHGKYLGYNANKNNPSHPDYGKTALDYSVAGKFKEWGVKWAVVMGNHDRDNAGNPKGTGTKLQNDFYMSLVQDGTYGCLYYQGMKYDTTKDGYYDKGGSQNGSWYHKYGDYIINITSNGKPIYSLVFMDSGQHEAPGHLENGYISAEQVRWYREQMIKIAKATYGEFNLEKGLVVPSMIFIHQPNPEFAFAAALATSPNGKGMVKKEFGFGYNEESPVTRIQREDVNYGMFAAMKEVGGTDIFCGHNHGNNSTIMYDGIRLNYLNRTGRRTSEAGSWKEERINYAKMVVIKADTYESEIVFALPKGITTEFINDRMWKR